MGLNLKRDKRGVWHADGYLRGQRVRRSMMTKVKAVAAEKAEAMEMSVARGLPLFSKFPRATVEAACDLYERHKNLSWGSLSDVRLFSRSLGAVRLRDLTGAMLLDFVDREKAGCKDSTKRKALTMAMAVVNHAAERGWCDPIAVRKPADNGSRSRWLTTAELDAFLLKAPEYLWPAFVFLAMTGARAGECVALDWSHLWQDTDGQWHARLWTRKGKGIMRERSVPLNPRAVGALAEAARLNRQGGVPMEKRRGPVFRNVYGSRLRVGILSSKVKGIAEAAGLEDVRLHDLRRTFASTLVQRGVPLNLVAELLGHSGLGQVSAYAHLAPSAKSTAVLAI